MQRAPGLSGVARAARRVSSLSPPGLGRSGSARPFAPVWHIGGARHHDLDIQSPAREIFLRMSLLSVPEGRRKWGDVMDDFVALLVSWGNRGQGGTHGAYQVSSGPWAHGLESRPRSPLLPEPVRQHLIPDRQRKGCF